MAPLADPPRHIAWVDGDNLLVGTNGGYVADSELFPFGESLSLPLPLFGEEGGKVGEREEKGEIVCVFGEEG